MMILLVSGGRAGAVVLKLKDKKGKLTDREVVFSVALKSPIVVSRDPYY